MGMDVTKAMQIATSALDAQRERIDVISANLANAQTTRTAEGGPYKRRDVVFEARPQSQPGVSSVEVTDVVADPTPGPRIFDPSHPDADSEGYVSYPNVQVMSEMVDLMSAVRAYEASVTAAETTRDMAKRTLDIAR